MDFVVDLKFNKPLGVLSLSNLFSDNTVMENYYSL